MRSLRALSAEVARAGNHHWHDLSIESCSIAASQALYTWRRPVPCHRLSWVHTAVERSISMSAIHQEHPCAQQQLAGTNMQLAPGREAAAAAAAAAAASASHHTAVADDVIGAGAAAVPLSAADTRALDAIPDSTNSQQGGDASAGQGGTSSEQQQQQQQQQKPRPTHFVSLRVSHSPEVLACIERVQQQLVSAAPALQPCLLEPVTAHMTLLVLRITTQEQGDVVGSVLASLPEVLQQQGLGQLQVTLQGLSTFRNQVLYLDVAPGPSQQQLQRFGDAVISHFCVNGSEIVVEEPGRGFTPHVTVAKTSRLLGSRHHRNRKGRGRTKIPAESWAELVDVSAGDVLLTELQICSMQGRRAGEFYKVTHSIQLPNASVPAPPAAVAAPSSERKRAPASPLAGAKRRFKQLLGAVACHRRAQLAEVDSPQQACSGG